MGALIRAGEPGSSPHARGTPVFLNFWLPCKRLIPACAGNTRNRIARWCSAGAHPRMRGEHSPTGTLPSFQSGSSPHARGTHPGNLVRHGTEGLIPACAGNTEWFSPLPACARAHPRMRGEHTAVPSGVGTKPGSSPHARGTPAPMQAMGPQHRLIPACAGNTVRGCALSLKSWAHPRMRGEHNHAANALRLPTGSSPHARGTRAASPFRDALTGLIPACAGNTRIYTHTWKRGWAHPRMRGEHAVTAATTATAMGSSPHARGTHVFTPTPGKGDGLIPACAGNTLASSSAFAATRAHPRMRGEHLEHLIAQNDVLGSSPHARGTPGHFGVAGGCAGLIPACAGNTWHRR